MAGAGFAPDTANEGEREGYSMNVIIVVVLVAAVHFVLSMNREIVKPWNRETVKPWNSGTFPDRPGSA
jgi:hypothetical protein